VEPQQAFWALAPHVGPPPCNGRQIVAVIASVSDRAIVFNIGISSKQRI
jgi:hypothetical protein